MAGFPAGANTSSPICEPISSLSINSSVNRTGEKTESTCHFNRLEVFEMPNISGTLPAQRLIGLGQIDEDRGNLTTTTRRR